jgi:hypothetical protein
MVFELLEYAVTPCPRYARRMGYLYESIAIRSRAGRCRAAWAPHQERTRQVILRAMEHCPRRRKAVVLGSGPLLDVPIAELSASFGEVILVDVVHPLGAHRRRRRFANVRAATAMSLPSPKPSTALPAIRGRSCPVAGRICSATTRR